MIMAALGSYLRWNDFHPKQKNTSDFLINTKYMCIYIQNTSDFLLISSIYMCKNIHFLPLLLSFFYILKLMISNII